MPRAPLSIRRGTVRDVPVILELIRGLAEYERLSHAVDLDDAPETGAVPAGHRGLPRELRARYEPRERLEHRQL